MTWPAILALAAGVYAMKALGPVFTRGRHLPARWQAATGLVAVPMLAGPGAISTVILLHSKATDWQKQIALLVGIVLVAAASYLVLALSARGARWLSPIALRLTTRIMGLLLAAIAMQFMLNALKDLKVLTF